MTEDNSIIIDGGVDEGAVNEDSDPSDEINCDCDECSGIWEWDGSW